MPGWQDIFGYTGHAIGQPSFTLTPYLGQGGNQSNEVGWNYQTPNLDEGGTARGGGWSYDMPKMFQGIINPVVREGVGANEGNVGTTQAKWNIDYAKLPNKGMTQYGRVDRVANAGGQQLYNPKLVTNDKVYGQITPAWNVKTDTTSGAAMMGKIVPAVAMSFLTSFMGGGGGASMLGKGAVGAARFAGGMGGSGAAPAATGARAGTQQSIMQNPQLLSLLRMILSGRKG